MSNIVRAVAQWYRNPILFVKQCLGAEPDRWQYKFLKDIADEQRAAACASKGVGKSACLAWAVWWWLVTRGPNCQVAVTSITADNLKGGLWKELSLWHSRSELLRRMFTWTKTEILSNQSQHRGHWKAEARTWAKDADQSQQSLTLAGLHADYMMFALDEVGGFPDSILATAEAGLASGKECKIAMVGNPTHTEGPLYAATTTRRHLWSVTHINGDPDDPDRSPRISERWAKEQIEQWGRDHPYVMVNVLGKFPPSSADTLIGPDEVREAMERELSEHDYRSSQKRFGIDVARFGDDDTVIFPRQGLFAGDPVSRPLKNARTEAIVAHVLFEKRRIGCELIAVDGTGGFGAGVVDGLIQAGEAPLEVHFSSNPLDGRYLNKRTEMWIEMIQWVKRGGKLPKIPQLVRELTSVKYNIQKASGKMYIEPKADVKKRLGFSPDLADALALTFCLPEMPSDEASYESRTGMRQQAKVRSEWNPLSKNRW